MAEVVVAAAAEQPPGGGARVVEVALQAEAPAAHLDHADHGYPPALPRVVLVGCINRVHLDVKRRGGFGVRFGIASAASIVWIVIIATAARWYLKIAPPITHAPNSVFALDGTLTTKRSPSLSSMKRRAPPWGVDSSFKFFTSSFATLCARAR